MVAARMRAPYLILAFGWLYETSQRLLQQYKRMVAYFSIHPNVAYIFGRGDIIQQCNLKLLDMIRTMAYVISGSKFWDFVPVLAPNMLFSKKLNNPHSYVDVWYHLGLSGKNVSFSNMLLV